MAKTKTPSPSEQKLFDELDRLYGEGKSFTRKEMHRNVNIAPGGWAWAPGTLNTYLKGLVRKGLILEDQSEKEYRYTLANPRGPELKCGKCRKKFEAVELDYLCPKCRKEFDASIAPTLSV